MQILILEHGLPVRVFTDEARRRLALANQTIRHLRNRCDLPDVSAVYIDSAKPLILLHAEPPAFLLEKASSIYSHRQPDGEYAARCNAFDVEWGWISEYPAVYSAPRALRLVERAA